MRVTDRGISNAVLNNLQKNRGEMNDLQNQAATQKRIVRPSDDPMAAAKVLALRTEERGSQQFVKNVNNAKSFLEYTDQSLSELSEALMRAKELAVQQASDAGASKDTRRMAATEVAQVFGQAVQIGNRKLGERYIFGGFQTQTQPFTSQGDYKGDSGAMKIQINKDAFVAMNIAGDSVFKGQGLSGDGMLKPETDVPSDTQELIEQQINRLRDEQQQNLNEIEPTSLRTPGSFRSDKEKAMETTANSATKGIDVLKTLKDFEIALQVNDKAEIQSSIDAIDSALTQVINARASVGSRLQTLTAAVDTHQKSILENKASASQLEDADVFQVVSDMTKADSTLRATLESSGKMMNKSLLDFLR